MQIRDLRWDVLYLVVSGFLLIIMAACVIFKTSAEIITLPTLVTVLALILSTQYGTARKIDLHLKKIEDKIDKLSEKTK